MTKTIIYIKYKLHISVKFTTITYFGFQQYHSFQSSWATNHYPPAKNENPIRDASDQHSKGHGGSETKDRAQLNQGESLSV